MPMLGEGDVRLLRVCVGAPIFGGGGGDLHNWQRHAGERVESGA